jgi:hypothetical protein
MRRPQLEVCKPSQQLSIYHVYTTVPALGQEAALDDDVGETLDRAVEHASVCESLAVTQGFTANPSCNDTNCCS